MREHNYTLDIKWTGNKGSGTAAYRSYERSYDIQGRNKPKLQGSADPSFLGDPGVYNPEEMFLISVSACHMLWYLHLCSDNKVIVEEYEDHPSAVMTEAGDQGGTFKEITLKPKISVRNGSDVALAYKLHTEAHSKCFIANSVNTEIKIEADVIEGE